VTARKAVAICGIDGSGKTSVAEALAQMYRDRGRKVAVIWLRYNHYLTKLVLAMGRLLGYTEYERFDGFRVGYHNFFRSRALSHLFIWTTWLDTFLASAARLYIPGLLSKRITICDRWIPDILVDLEIDTAIPVADHPVYGPLFWCLVPRGIPVLLLHRPWEDIRSARPEHRRAANRARRPVAVRERGLEIVGSDLPDSGRKTGPDPPVAIQ